MVFYIPGGAYQDFFLSMPWPCAEIATAEAAMADEDGGNEETPREAMEVSSSCFWTIKRYQKS